MTRLKRILAVLAVNGLLLTVGIAVAELIFGGWRDPSHLNRLNLLKNCDLQFDASNLYADPNPVIKYSRDQYGLRGSYGTPADIDILTVGGSTTDQRYIRDGETWQDVLQARFREAGVAVAVANAGVDGQSTYGHIKDFEWWFPTIPDLEPDYVLFYVGLNDFHKQEGSSYDGVADTGWKQKVKDNSAVWNAGRTLRNAYVAMVVKKIGHRSLDFGKVDWTHDALQTDYAFMDTRLHEYAGRLRVLADMTHALGGKPIFVSQISRNYRVTPDGVEGSSDISPYDDREINGVDFYHMMRRLDAVMEAVAIEKSALYVDLARHDGWVDADFYDFAHMTPQGARKLGDLLYAALKDVYAEGQTR